MPFEDANYRAVSPGDLRFSAAGCSLLFSSFAQCSYCCPIPTAAFPRRSLAEALTGGLCLPAAELSHRPFRNTCRRKKLPRKRAPTYAWLSSTVLDQCGLPLNTATKGSWPGKPGNLVATLAEKVMKDDFPGRENRNCFRSS